MMGLQPEGSTISAREVTLSRGGSAPSRALMAGAAVAAAAPALPRHPGEAGKRHIVAGR